MAKRILSVGQCGPDDAAIRRLLTRHFECEVVVADGLEDVAAEFGRGSFDLVLVNRKLDRDFSDGLDVIRRLKANPATAGVPVMLVTNYANYQDEAVAAGALRGFGKLELENDQTLQRLGLVLGE